MRIGQGFDVHKLVPGRPLILGGIEVPYEKGLLGHSDADVLLHTIMDAVLGALGAGDIGQHFPDTDPAFAGADSALLSEQVAGLMRERGYTVGNIDATVICQAPKLSPHLGAMTERIAQIYECEKRLVNLKATTTEGLGFTGRGEGIACQAVVLLVKTS